MLSRNNNIGRQMLSQSKFYMGYSRWDDDKNRFETWDESVERVMNMHREKYKDKMTDELNKLFVFAEKAYKQKRILAAQRTLQFGGEQILKKNMRLYNCTSTYVDRAEVFSEIMYMLLCGCGVGFSVQNQHIKKLPKIKKRYDKKSKVFQISDSIEGWADAFGVLLSTYFEDGGQFPEFKGCHVAFDFSKIRPKGAYISGGFKAPGPDGLRIALQKCEDMLNRELDNGNENIRSIVAYDFIMFMADAVLSGGVRRSATICLFSKDDLEMRNAKIGDWFITNPQRARSNNSVMIKRDDITFSEWCEIIKSVRDYGEPGFILVDDLDIVPNPCVEIGMYPQFDNISGFQCCNLVEINGGMCFRKEDLLIAAKAASIMGTLQAGYTDVGYLSETSKKIIEREALLGVSITGWMNNPGVLFDVNNMREGAEEVKKWNRVVAGMIGINVSARTTTVKPSGNASVLLGTASGIHGEHSPMYIRNVQMNEQDEVLHLIKKINPKMVEKSVYSNTDYVVSFPILSPETSIYKSELMGVKQLQFVQLAQQNWVEYGTNKELCVIPNIRHNVSNTITVDNWEEVTTYIYDNRHSFAGISLLSGNGDKAYAQAPFTEIHTVEQLVALYGDAVLFASGLIVDGLHAFNNDLWKACNTVCGFGEKLDDECSSDLLKRDWVRRAEKFAKNYFDNDLTKMTNCLKDCHNRHKWVSIEKEIQFIDFSEQLSKKVFVDMDTMGAVACSGTSCEI